MSKTNAGFTLLEAIIAIALFMVLTISMLSILHYTGSNTERLIATQNAFENARGSLDAIIMNVQMAHAIQLTTDTGNNLEILRMWQDGQDSQDPIDGYVFGFDVNAPATAIGSYQRLRFGRGRDDLPGYNEFAGGIASIIATITCYCDFAPAGCNCTPGCTCEKLRLYITITTACPPQRPPITLTGSVDIRGKIR